MMITDWAGIVWRRMPKKLRRFTIALTQQRFTVSAAVLIVDSDGRILLLDHHLRPRSGWGLPGGFLERGEQLEEGIRREVIEETGLELRGPRLSHVNVVGAHVEAIFVAEADGEPTINCREIKGFGWFNQDDLPEALDPCLRRMIFVLHHRFEKSLAGD